MQEGRSAQSVAVTKEDHALQDISNKSLRSAKLGIQTKSRSRLGMQRAKDLLVANSQAAVAEEVPQIEVLRASTRSAATRTVPSRQGIHQI